MSLSKHVNNYDPVL